jgi:hypothetical protein
MRSASAGVGRWQNHIVLRGPVREIDLGIIPAPAGAGALVLHGEEEPHCLVVFMAWDAASNTHPAAIATFNHCRQSIFGYPNDEAYSGVPDTGYGFFEVLDSDWNDQLNEFNRLRFPDSPPRTGLRHYFMGCHDASGQFLARDVSVQVFPGGYTSALKRGAEASPRKRVGSHRANHLDAPDPASEPSRNLPLTGRTALQRQMRTDPRRPANA